MGGINIKCKTCIRELEYKTSLPCRYCKWNNEKYWGREESKMVNDEYIYVKNKDSNIPY